MTTFLIPVLSTFHLLSVKTGLQIPTEVPHPDNNTPLDLTNPADIIIYIVLPIVAIVLYFIWRKKSKKRKNN